MILAVYDTKLMPVYDENTGRFVGWNVLYFADTDKNPWPVARSRSFRETLFRNSYRAACRFQGKLQARCKEETK